MQTEEQIRSLAIGLPDPSEYQGEKIKVITEAQIESALVNDDVSELIYSNVDFVIFQSQLNMKGEWSWVAIM